MTASGHGTVRGFRLVVEPGATTDGYWLRLEETNGSPATPPKVLARHRPCGAPDVADTVLAALRESRHPRTSLSAGRRTPLALAEPAGVRLALALLAVEPVTKGRRRRAILSGVGAMSAEEAYYWYARATGPAASRGRRALRILLADDGRTGITS